jgi:hypothetical protein
MPIHSECDVRLHIQHFFFLELPWTRTLLDVCCVFVNVVFAHTVTVNNEIIIVVVILALHFFELDNILWFIFYSEFFVFLFLFLFLSSTRSHVHLCYISKESDLESFFSKIFTTFYIQVRSAFLDVVQWICANPLR